MRDIKYDAGIYYFKYSYMYCNYYPKFTKDFNDLQSQKGAIIMKEKDTFSIHLDLNNNKLKFLINNIEYLDTNIERSNNQPVFPVVGMFRGEAFITKNF